jgi:hypothetical protein
MNSSIFERWCNDDRFLDKFGNSIFFIENGGIICKACKSSYLKSRDETADTKWNTFVNIGAKRVRIQVLERHVLSASHLNASLTYNRINSSMLLNRENSSPDVIPKFSTSKESLALTETDITEESIINTLSPDDLLKNIIKDKIHIVYWMVQSNIPNSAFLSLQNLIDNVGNNNLLKMFKHSSNTSFYEFLNLIYSTYKDTLISEIKKFRFYSILVDDSVDVDGINQMSIYVRYFGSDLEVKTSFLALKEIGIEGATAKNLYALLMCVLEEYTLDIKNMVAFASDGAANMRGDVGGLCKLLQNSVPDIIDYYCAAHRFNLVIKNSLKSLNSLNITQELFYDISNYINRSSNRKVLFSSIQKQISPDKKPTQLSQPLDVRWTSCCTSIHSVVNKIAAVEKFFKHEDEVEKTQKGQQMYEMFKDESFLSHGVILDTILHEMYISTKCLQKNNLNIGDINKIINDVTTKLQILKKDESIDKMCETVKNHKLTHSTNTTNIKNIVTDLIDTIIKNIEVRFTDSFIVEKLLFIFDPTELKKLGNDDKKWQTHGQKYNEIVRFFKDRFPKERYHERNEDWRIFKEQIIYHLHDKTSIKDVCSFIIKSHQFAVTTTLVRIAQIILLIPPTTVPVEDGFSVLNDVKDDKRNCLRQNSMNCLMLIKINMKETDLNVLLQKVAEKWFEKKRRNLAEIAFLFGLNKSRWRKSDDDEEDEIIDDDEMNYSALNLLDEFESIDCIIEGISSENESDVSVEHKDSTKKRVKTKPHKNAKHKLDQDWEREVEVLESFKINKRKKIDET